MKEGRQTLLPLKNERPRRRDAHWALLPFVIGVLIGLAVSIILLRPQTQSVNVYVEAPGEAPERRDYRKLLDELKNGDAAAAAMGGGAPLTLAQEVPLWDAVFYAVVMSDRHSAEQLEATRNTWARDIPQKNIAFFIPSETEGREDENIGADDGVDHYGEIDLQKETDPEGGGSVVELSGADNAEMQALKYMCRHKLNRTKWFLVSDGDLYVKTKALENYLQPLEGVPQMGYLGKPVKRDPIGRVCLPGPGSVLSRATLSSLCPKLDRCSAMARAGLFKTDTAIGECIVTQLGVQCNKEGQPQDLFLKFDATKKGSITEPKNSKTLDTALTVYPITDNKLMYQVHHQVATQELNTTQHLLRRLKVTADRMTHLLPRSEHSLSLQTSSVTSKKDIPLWTLINRNLLMDVERINPAENIPESWKQEVAELVEKAMGHLSIIQEEEEEELVIRRVVDVYWRVEPSSRINYIIDFEAVKKEDEFDYMLTPKQFKVALTRQLSAPEFSPVQARPADKYVTIAVVLSSDQLKQFQNFVDMLSRVLEHNQRVNLIVVRMKSPNERQRPRKDSNTVDPNSILSLLEKKYPKATFKLIDSPHILSRAHATALVIHETRPSEILFLADLDFEFDNSFIERCSSLPLQGQQAYFPIVFSRVGPHPLSPGNHTKLKEISASSGYWLAKLSSTACIHAADILAVVSQSETKGIPTAVEMNEVYSGLIQKGYEVVRMPDTGLRRVFANRTCELDLYGEQHDPCEVGVAEPYGRLYLKSQLSSLFFDHDSEHKF